eukprot:7380034-Prymnesium_polylepis.1
MARFQAGAKCHLNVCHSKQAHEGKSPHRAGSDAALGSHSCFFGNDAQRPCQTAYLGPCHNGALPSSHTWNGETQLKPSPVELRGLLFPVTYEIEVRPLSGRVPERKVSSP